MGTATSTMQGVPGLRDESLEISACGPAANAACNLLKQRRSRQKVAANQARPGESQCHAEGGATKGGVSKRKQTQTNADKRKQTQRRKRKQTQANASKREQTWTNANKRLHPPFSQEDKRAVS